MKKTYLNRLKEWAVESQQHSELQKNKGILLFPKTFSTDIFTQLKTQNTLILCDFDISHLTLGIAQEFAWNLYIPMPKEINIVSYMAQELSKSQYILVDSFLGYYDFLRTHTPIYNKPREMELPSLWFCSIIGNPVLYQKKIINPFYKTFVKQLKMLNHPHSENIAEDDITINRPFVLSDAKRPLNPYGNLTINVTDSPVRIPKTMERYYRPQTNIIDGVFDYHSILNDVDINLISNVLKAYRRITCNTIMTMPTHLKSKKLYSMFEQVIEIKKWREHKCSSNNLIATFIKYDKQILKQPISTHLVTPKNQIFWEIRQNYHAILKPFIMEGIKDGRTAKELVSLIKDKYNLTVSLPMLAKLKRDFGIKSYKPSKKPRATKKSCNKIILKD